MRASETSEQLVLARTLRLDHRGALALLRRIATDRSVMLELRRLYMEETSRSSCQGIQDDVVLLQLAERIGRGALSVSAFQHPEHPGPPEGESSTIALVVNQAADATQQAAKKQEAKEEPADDMLASVDPAKQAAALVQAAEEGVPFCEECEKKRKARS